MARTPKHAKVAKGTEGFVKVAVTVEKGPKGKKVPVISGEVLTIEPNAAGLAALAKVCGGMEAVGAYVAAKLLNDNKNRLAAPFNTDGSPKVRKDGSPVVADLKNHVRMIAETTALPPRFKTQAERDAADAISAIKAGTLSPDKLAALLKSIRG